MSAQRWADTISGGAEGLRLRPSLSVIPQKPCYLCCLVTFCRNLLKSNEISGNNFWAVGNRFSGFVTSEGQFCVLAQSGAVSGKSPVLCWLSRTLRKSVVFGHFPTQDIVSRSTGPIIGLALSRLCQLGSLCAARLIPERGRTRTPLPRPYPSVSTLRGARYGSVWSQLRERHLVAG